ncbi:hypothetical protein [Veillonella caviae]|uniref:hypothetical protein n=1 Tax=Veillonella caviae TaxID=248316 RepID=UPI002A90FC3A|nr:hypothetical protein [Veillonella caviae]MDY5409269.1 hypothetical protein [Veillonella caviae]
MNIKSIPDNALLMLVRDINGSDAEVVVKSKVGEPKDEIAMLTFGVIAFLQNLPNPDRSKKILIAALDHFFNDTDVVHKCANSTQSS